MTDRYKERGPARFILGPKPSDLIVVVADPGITTTALITSIVLSVGVDECKPIAIFSRRLRALEWGINLLSVESGVPLGKIESGLLLREDWPLLSRAAGILAGSPIYISDATSLTNNEIRTQLHDHAAGKIRGISIIDDPRMIGHQKDSLKDDEIVDVLNSLKSIASDIDQPIIVFAPLTLLGMPAAVEAASLVIHVVHRRMGKNDAELSPGCLATIYLQDRDIDSSTSSSTCGMNIVDPSAPVSVAPSELTKIREWLRGVFRLMELRYESTHKQP